MRCKNCGQEIPAGSLRCPACGVAIHYDGNTMFYSEAREHRLSLPSLFEGVRQKHPKGSAGKVFIGGTATTTPATADMLEKWQRPWLFSRFFVGGLIFCLLSYILYGVFGHPLGWLLLVTIGAMVLPLTVLLFFWELNIPRDIPIYTVIGIFLIGGVLSVLCTMLGSIFVNVSDAIWAPLTEEPAKMLIAALFIYLLHARYGLSGLLIGAAVGAGFACFENIYYVLWNGFYFGLTEIGDTTFAIEYSMGIFMLRNLSTLGGGHTFWAAVEGGALALAKGKGELNTRLLLHPVVLRCLLGASAIHAFNNSGLFAGELLTMKVSASTGDYLNYPIVYVSQPIVTVASVALVIWLLKPCLKQILDAVDEASFSGGASPVQQPAAALSGAAAAQALPGVDMRTAPVAAQNALPAVLELVCTEGPLQGQVWRCTDQPMVLGRGAQNGVPLPEGVQGVSRQHCVIQRAGNGWTVRDLNATYGTYLSSGRLAAGQEAPLRNGERIYLGSKQVCFRVDIR